MSTIKSDSTSHMNNEENISRMNYEQFHSLNMENNKNSLLKYNGKVNSSMSFKSGNSNIFYSPSSNTNINTEENRTKIIYKPNIEVVKKTKDVPISNFQNRTKIIEVPEVKFVNKYEYDAPEIIEKYKYVPKEVIKYNIIQKPVITKISTEKNIKNVQSHEKINYNGQNIIQDGNNYMNENNALYKESNCITQCCFPSQNEDMNEYIDYSLHEYTNSNNYNEHVHNLNDNYDNYDNVHNNNDNVYDNNDNVYDNYDNLHNNNDNVHNNNDNMYDNNSNIYNNNNNNNNNRNIYEMNGNVYNITDNSVPKLMEPFGPQIEVKKNEMIENVFVPKVEKIVEIEKKVNIPINLPVPYIVPKPKIINVDVPVFKFIDKYVPVPVNKKIIPKVTWSDKVYKVDCVIEKPYLVYHDIIKIVPTDSKIVVREYPKGINKINPSELYETDVLALWMRVNADLKEEKDKLMNKTDSLSNHTCECSECDTCEKCLSYDLNSAQDTSTIKSSTENCFDNLPIHPGHPLEMVHLQNKWLKQNTNEMAKLYDETYLNAHKNAMHNLSRDIPCEAEIDIKQIAQIKKTMEKREFDYAQDDVN
ncbi:inner membrane complex protein 1b, putative [Hepatocystis sp. ex Piliocolobus tephrosceles]|nr:inner membrane complex protein 1b, putative [Hepatocystis sp. ex Piliocolobus tephrosceles]